MTSWCSCAKPSFGFAYSHYLNLWVKPCCHRPTRAFVNPDGSYRSMPIKTNGPDMASLIRHSNMIEGVVSLKEIDQSLDAWFYLRIRKTLTTEIILRVHRLIMLNFLHGPEIGQYRKCKVYITGTQSRVADPNDIPDLMDDWIKLYNSGEDPKILHIEFEKIHPFIDGNGRVGRMLMWHQQMLQGTQPTFIRFEERENYYNWFH